MHSADISVVLASPRQHLPRGGQQHGGGAAGAGARLQQVDGRGVGLSAAPRQLPARQVVQPHLETQFQQLFWMCMWDSRRQIGAWCWWKDSTC